MGEMALMVKEATTMAGDDGSNCGDVNCCNNEVMRIVLMLMAILRGWRG